MRSTQGNLDAVLADHAEDIVMFDVPPPEIGVKPGGMCIASS
jgi:hypothetical protein